MLRAILAFFIAAAIPSAVFADAPAVRPVRVAILPFDVIGEAGHEWVGRALQSGLAGGLPKGSGITATLATGLPPADATAAIAQAKSMDADVVIISNLQLAGQMLRVTVRLVSVWSGETIGTVRNDADVRGLFDMEDLLGERVGQILTPIKHADAAKASPPATFEIVGPTVATSGPRYLDGNIASVIAKPQQFADDYNRYYYQSYSTFGCCYSYGCGYGSCRSYGYCGGCPYPGNGILCPIATPVRGW